MQSVELNIDGKIISVYSYRYNQQAINAVINSVKFTNWMNSVLENNSIVFNQIEITDVDFFGQVRPDKLGFAKFKVLLNGSTPEDNFGHKIMGNIVFLRGNSITIQIRVDVYEPDQTFQTYMLLVRQCRIPGCGYVFETCAGMMDDQNNPVGAMVKEVQEETGIELTHDMLIDLGSFKPSPGACDEIIHMYAAEISMTRQRFIDQSATQYGLIEEGEIIDIVFVPYLEYEDALDQSGDAKAIACWYKYNRLINQNQIINVAQV